MIASHSDTERRHQEPPVSDRRRMRHAEWAAYVQGLFSAVAYVLVAAEDRDVLGPWYYLVMAAAHAALGYQVGHRRSATAAGILCVLQVAGFAWQAATGAPLRMPLIVAIFLWIYGRAFVEARAIRRSSRTPA